MAKRCGVCDREYDGAYDRCPACAKKEEHEKELGKVKKLGCIVTILVILLSFCSCRVLGLW